MKNIYLAALAIVLIVIFTGVASYSFLVEKNSLNNAGQEKQEEEEVKNTKELKKFNTYQEFEDFLANQNTSLGSIGHGGGINNMAIETLAMDEEMGLGAPSTKSVLSGEGDTGSSDGLNDYSDTNIQVKGVDEADIIKTDGNYIYIVANNIVYIVDAVPAAESRILSEIKLDANPSDIYINGDSLVVFGNNSYNYLYEKMSSIVRQNNSLFFKVFDITDRENPSKVRDLSFEGNYTNSRMIGDYVYFVTSNYNYYYLASEPLLPAVMDNGNILKAECGDNDACLAPDIYYFDVPYDSYNLTSVVAIDVVNNDVDINRDVYVLSGNQSMYVSSGNIYITYTEYINERQLIIETMRELLLPRLSSRDQQLISQIESIDDKILSEAEKDQKISLILERHISSLQQEEADRVRKELDMKMRDRYRELANELEKTIIHKIEIDKAEMKYLATGEVPGYVLNQFSMDESGGHFRIATTKNESWSEFLDESEKEPYSNLFVLDKDLNIVGSVEKLARGERIYSVRFMQDRAYMVTFKQVDPLFVIDLKDPGAPQVLGELKMPGFSNYLHPYNDNLLIGIGKDTKLDNLPGETERVVTMGVKLSLFDVANVGSPREIDSYVLGGAGSDSIALYDHKAFLLSVDKNLLAIPVTIREEAEDSGWGELSFSGAAVFNISEEGFELKGQIDHSDGGTESDRMCLDYCYYNNNVLRTLYINDTLYTMSNNYLKMNNIETLDVVNILKLPRSEKEDIIDEGGRPVPLLRGAEVEPALPVSE